MGNQLTCPKCSLTFQLPWVQDGLSCPHCQTVFLKRGDYLAIMAGMVTISHEHDISAPAMRYAAHGFQVLIDTLEDRKTQ